MAGGFLFVSSEDDYNIKVFNATAPYAHISNFNTGLNDPTGLVVSNGLLFVADYGDSDVKVFSIQQPIPTMSQWGLLVFGLLIMNLSVFFVQRRELI